MNEVIQALQRAGYTSNWSKDWPERRWFNGEGGIVEVITSRHYMRITPVSDGTFQVREYFSEKYPNRPKTEFFIDPFRESKVLDFPELLAVITALWTVIKEQKAA